VRAELARENSAAAAHQPPDGHQLLGLGVPLLSAALMMAWWA